MNALCPVCNQPVDPSTAPTSTFQGVTYYLRCPHCKERFDADPGRFLADPRSGCDEKCGHEVHLIGVERPLR